MDILIWIVPVIVTVLLQEELLGGIERLNLFLVRRLARSLPAPHSERYEEEWSRVVRDDRGPITSLMRVISLALGMRKIRRMIPKHSSAKEPTRRDSRGARVMQASVILFLSGAVAFRRGRRVQVRPLSVLLSGDEPLRPLREVVIDFMRDQAAQDAQATASKAEEST